MPRAIWSGAISFGLITIPVRLYPAVNRKNVRFNQLDGETGARIRQRKVSAETGEEVPYDQIVKGYEITKDNYVIVTDEEMAALDPVASRTIDIAEFVDQSDIDPVFYDSAYFLAPDELARKAYVVLTQAMEAADKVAMARFVMRTKQYLAAVRPVDGHLMISTMVYADEINAAEGIDEFSGLDEVVATDKEIAMAEQLIESLSEEFDATRFEDTYRQQVLDLIERKAAGEEGIVETPEAPAAENVVDLMAALEASVAAAKDARSRHPSAKKKAAAKKKAPAKKKASAKKSTAKKAAKAKKDTPARKSA